MIARVCNVCVCVSMWACVSAHIHMSAYCTVCTQIVFICIHIRMCEGAVVLMQASALQNKRSHVSSDEQHSQTIRLSFYNMVAFCLQPASWGFLGAGWTQRHLYPRPLSSLNMYLVFLIGQSWLTELSWQSGRSVERGSVVPHQNSSTKNNSSYA